MQIWLHNTYNQWRAHTHIYIYICKNIIIYICIWYSYMYIFHIWAYRTEIKRVHFNLFHWQLVQFWWILQEETHEPPTIWRLRIAHMYDLNAASGLAYQPPFFCLNMDWLMVYDGSVQTEKHVGPLAPFYHASGDPTSKQTEWCPHPQVIFT